MENFYAFTNKHIVESALVWALLAFILGAFTVNLLEATVVSLMCLFMYFAAIWGVRFILYIQYQNSLLKNKKIIVYCSWFLWGFGLLGSFYFLLASLYLVFIGEESGFYLVMAWFFPLGFSAGAAQSLKANA